MLQRRIHLQFARVLGVAGCAAVLATATASAASSSGAGTSKKCGGGSLCATSLKSTPPPVVGGGPGAPPPPPAPASTFRVTAKSAAPATQRISGGSQMIETLNTGRRLICQGYHRRDASWFQFMLQTKTSMHINYLITDSIVNTTTSRIHFCLGAPYEFRTFSGKPARLATLPDGTKGFTGLLPMCNALPPSKTGKPRPCIVSIGIVDNPKSSTHVNAVLRLQIPAVTKGGDPWGGA